MKKILYVSPNGYLGGAEKFLVMAVKQHRSICGEEVGSLFFNPGVAPELLKAENFSVRVLQNKFKLRQSIQFLRALWEIRSYIRQNKYNVIHSTMAYGHLVMAMATLGLGVKRIWFQHGPVSGMLDKLASLLPVDVILFNSRYLMAEHLRANFNFFKSQKLILRLGVDQDLVRSLNKSSKINVLMVGRISRSKGFHVVLEALNSWTNSGEEWLNHFHFTLLGSANTESDQQYQKELEELGQSIGSNVTLAPFTPDVNSFYAQSEILIQPSLIGEGFGLVLAEAMAAGLLVLGPSYGGGTEILANGDTGFTFDFRDPGAMSEVKETLQKFLAAPESFEGIRSNGQRLVVEEYSTTAMMEQLKEINSTHES